MKKCSKFIVITLSAIIGLLIVLALLVSPIAKSYINKNGEQLIGRDIKVEKLLVNIFTGHVRICGLAVKESDKATDFVTLDELDTRVALPKLLGHKLAVKRLLLDGLYLHLTQSGEEFNFNDIIEHFSDGEDGTEEEHMTTETAEMQEPAEDIDSAESSDWIFGFYNTRLLNSHLFYEDYAVGSQWDMDHIAIEIPDITLGGEDNSNVDLSLSFVDGGELSTSISSNAGDKSYTINVSLKEFTLHGLLPYIQQSMATEDLHGILNVALNINGNMEHLMQMNISGTAALSDIYLSDSKDNELLRADTVSVSINNLDLLQNIYSIGDLRVNGLKANYEIFADSTSNVSRMLTASADKEESTGEATTADEENADDAKNNIHIDRFSIDNSTIVYTDHTLPEKFSYTISDISVVSSDFNTTGSNSVEMTAVLQNTGTADIKWRGNLTDIANQNISISISNLSLKEFTPYTLALFGYPVKEGNLVFKSQNIIKNYMLNGSNSLDMYKFTLEPKNRKVDAAYNFPLRAGLYILKDKDEHIKLELPVSGSINSPEFSYKKLIMKTLGNLLVKVVTSPATFLAEAMGLKTDSNEIAIDALQKDFTTEQYDKFAQYADVVRQKPEMKLTVRQDIDFNQALGRQAVTDLKRDYYIANSGKSAEETDEIIVMQEIDRIDLNSSKLKNFADSLILARGIEATQTNITEKAKAIYGTQAQEEVSNILSQRNDVMVNHLVKQHNLPAESVEVQQTAIDSLLLYKGRDKITLGLTISETDVENTKEDL